MKKLTTTSYALLALLAVRPWSAYELAGQMRRGFSMVWPRAQSAIYAEPKVLVEHGFAKVTRERTRSVYAITPAGRRALREWLARVPEPPRLESEPLVRVFFGEHGSKEDLLQTIARVREAAEDMRAQLVAQIAGYLDAGGPFPERWHVIGVGARGLLEHAASMERWADWAEREVKRWKGTGAETAEKRGRALLREALRSAEEAE